MKTNRGRWPGASALIIALCLTWVTQAQTQPTGQQKIEMINAARADLYAQLAREIKGLNISEQNVVANAVNMETIRAGFVQAVIKGVQESEPQFVSPDLCLVEGTITLQQVVENLNKLVTTQDNKVVDNFETIKRYNSVSVVKAQGAGSLAAPTPQGGGRANDNGLADALAALEGPGQHKLNAKNAAEMDAYASLAKQLKGIYVSDNTTIYNSAQSRWTETTTSALVKGARVKRYFARGKDLLGCEMEITIQQIVENIQKNSTLFDNGKEISTERVKRMNGDLVVVPAFGYGAVASFQPAQTISTGGVIGSVQ